MADSPVNGPLLVREKSRILDAATHPKVVEHLGKLESPTAKLVCFYLMLVGEAEPSELKAELGLNLLTVYPVLDVLVDNGSIERDGTTVRFASGG